MEAATMVKVNSSYGSAEAMKVAEMSETAQADSAVSKAAAVTVQPVSVDAKGDAEQQGGSQQKEHAPSEATVDDAVKRANLKMSHTRCEYSYHEQTNRVMIKVIDKDTDKVVREIPPEKSLDMLQKIWELAGMLVDEKR